MRDKTIKTELIIFDLDGTLCDTFDDIYLSLKYTLNLFDISAPSHSEVKSFIGDGLAMLIERTLKVTNQLHLKEDIMQYFLQYYKIHCTDSTLLFSGMDIVLNTCKNNNISMAVVSNKAEHLVKIILDELLLTHYFKYIFGGDSFEQKKPNPMPLNFIIDNLTVNKDNAIMVGDSDNDVLAGQKAGIKTVFCSFGYSELKKSKSDFTINSPIELLDIII